MSFFIPKIFTYRLTTAHPGVIMHPTSFIWSSNSKCMDRDVCYPPCFQRARGW